MQQLTGIGINNGERDCSELEHAGIRILENQVTREEDRALN